MEINSEFMPWYIAGPMAALVMFLLFKWGKEFGISGNYRVMCTMLGAGKKHKLFDIDWQKHKWNLAFAFGILLGAVIVQQFFPHGKVHISQETVKDLLEIGVVQDNELVPMQIFAIEKIFTLRSFIFVVLGGFFVGFGARYAGGCTSGHVISGISNLQIPSLIVGVGFFLGGLIMTHIFFPYILKL